MKKLFHAICLFALLLSTAMADEPLRIFVAASTVPALEELAVVYEAETGTKLAINGGSSSQLVRQLSEGGSADLFLSANKTWMDTAIKKQLVVADSRQALLTNRLALVVPSSDSEVSFGELNGFQKVAVADEYVPLGIYTRQALAAVNWQWLDGRLIPCQNARGTLTMVESGAVDAGVVYFSGAVSSSRIRIVGLFPETSHDPITYEIARCQNASPAATTCLKWLMKPETGAVFERYGLAVPKAPQTVSASLSPKLPIEVSAPEKAGAPRSPVWSAIWLSIKVAACATLLCLIPGIWLGWLLAKRQFPGKNAINAVVHLPLVVPPVVTGYALLWLFGKRGPLGGWLLDAFGIEIALTWKAAVLASAVVGLPFIVRLTRASAEKIDTELEEYANVAGATGFQIMRFVILPLAMPGILAGTILCFARSLGEFGATIMVAGNIPDVTRTLPLAIYASLENPDGASYTWRLAAISAVTAVSAVAFGEWLVRKRLDHSA